MKALNLFITLITVVLTPAIAQAEDKPVEELSNTRRASVVLRITTDPKVLSMDFNKTNYEQLHVMIFPPEVLHAASHEILDTLKNLGEWFDFSIQEEPKTIAGLQTTRIRISVNLPEDMKPAAKEFLEALVEKLKIKLQKEHDFGMNLYYNHRKSYGHAVIEAQRHLEELKARQSQLGEGRGMLDQESVRQRIYEYERAVIENGMQQSVLGRRSEELVRQISESHMKTDETAVIDAEIRELQEVSAHATHDFKRLERERDRLFIELKNKSEDERRKLADELSKQTIEAKNGIDKARQQIETLTHRKQQLERMAAEDIQDLNRQLRETTMQLEELAVQERYHMGYGPGSISESMNYEMLEVKIEAAEENLRRALIQAEEFQMQIRLIQSPTVSYDKIIMFSEKSTKEEGEKS